MKHQRTAILLTLALQSCGYTIGARHPQTHAISVSPVTDSGPDLDAAALINTAVRRAIARGPKTRLASRSSADARLELELVNTGSALAPLAAPELRALQYRATVSLRGRLLDAQENLLWSSELITTEAEYLSRSGEVEELEGARRQALKRAAEAAAERIITALRWRQG